MLSLLIILCLPSMWLAYTIGLPKWHGFLSSTSFGIYILFIYFYSPDFIPPTHPKSTLWLFHIPYTHAHPISRRMSQHHPLLHKTFLLPRVSISWWLGASSLTESRPGSPLQHMWWEPHISWCMLPGLWLSERSWMSRLIVSAYYRESSSSASSSISLFNQRNH